MRGICERTGDPHRSGSRFNSADELIVALGDSITEGYGSTNNAFRGWTDRLAERLAARGRVKTLGGAQCRVKAVILLKSINDIGRSFSPRGPSDPVTADAMIAADKQIIERAH